MNFVIVSILAFIFVGFLINGIIGAAIGGAIAIAFFLGSWFMVAVMLDWFISIFTRK